MDINNYNSDNNLINKLIEGLTIDNNIFGYEIIMDKIKLINIPNQILFYNGNEDIPLSNQSILYSNYKLKQNNEIIKTDELYSFDYQFIIQEPIYSTFYDNAQNIINYPSDSSDDQSNNFNQKTFYGRTNTAKFKLCHKYCATCKILGISDDIQQCFSCLEDFQYDYFNEY